jgi:hypothetical protein
MSQRQDQKVQDRRLEGSGRLRARVIGVVSPNWVHTAMGVKFNERYFMDPEYRQVENRNVADWIGSFNTMLRTRFARYDVDWEPVGISGIAGMYDPEGLAKLTVGLPQPFPVVTAMFGGEIVYFDNDNPDSRGEPLAGISSAAEVHIPDFATTFPVSVYLQQYADLVSRFGKDKVDLSFLYLHSPLTIAYRLRGEQLFLDMVDDPELASAILEAAHATSLGVYEMYEHIGDRPERLLPIATCIASLISPDVYRKWEIPWLRRQVERHPKALIHSCGRSSHVLDLLAELPGIAFMEVGAGTDIARTRALFREATINYVVDTPKFRNHTPEQVDAEIRGVIRDNEGGPLTIIWPAETGTPIETIEAIYATISDYNQNG